MTTLASWVIARMGEPSTMSGIALIATAVQSAVMNHDWQSLIATGLGALAVIFREGRQA